jgi:glycosyltransferase involved in cell wall biosynthesis
MVEGRSVPAERLETFFYGIPFEEFEVPSEAEVAAARKGAAIPPGAAVIATVGRLAPQKGLDLLVAAFARLAGKHPGARLLLVGEGPERDRVSDLAAEKGVDGRVCLAGYREDVRPWIAMADVFAIPSLYEGGPLTLFEAMRLGRAIVSTPVGLVPAAIEDGRNGLLVPTGDEEALARALDRLLADRDFAAGLGRRAREDSGAWDLRHAVDRLTRFYERLVNRW